MKKSVPIALALVVTLVVGLVVVVMMMDEVERAAGPCGPDQDPGVLNAVSVTGPIPDAVGPWQREQLTNAAAIINAGAEVGISRRGQTIGVMTAMGESGLRVLDYGDAAGPDSRGLFQQRANGAWGSLADRMDPRRSSLNFFKALMRVEGWATLPPTIAAHRTQINADPYHYEPFYDDAVDVLDALAPAASTATPVAAQGDPYSLGEVQPQLRELVNVLAPMFNISTVGGYRPSATDPQGHPAGLAADFMIPVSPAGRRQGAALATYARNNAGALNIDYIIWYQQIWSTTRASEGWRPMSDRGSPTANHFDHVHINVKPSGRVSTAIPAALVAGGFECPIDVGLDAGTVVYPVDENSDRRNWRTYSSLRASWHTGTDFSVPCGTPVRAAHGGTISIETSLWAGPYLTKVSTGPTSLTTWYAHMEAIEVSDGDVVTAGEIIGSVGSLGNSTGCHLHFEVHSKNGSIYGPDNVNPTVWLAENVGKYIGGTGAVPPGGIRVVQANIKQGRSRADFLIAREAVVSKRPDFITWNEIVTRSPAELRPAGYATWRDASVYPETTSRGTAISWRTDRWSVVSKGRFQITKSPVRLDNRFAHWVVLRDDLSGAYVSVLVTHAMVNPDKYSYGAQTQARRKVTYRGGMGRIAAAVTELRGLGPVILGGDLNSHYRTNGGLGDPWGPQAVLGRAGLQSSFQMLGELPGAYVDYVMATPDLVPVRQVTFGIRSDHPGLLVDLVGAGLDPR